MKDEIRVLGIDDASFDKEDEEVLLIGAFFRGGNKLYGVVSTRIDKDGEDATLKIINMINDSKFKSQVQCIFLDGIAFGGFNIVNIDSIAENTGIPVVTVVRDLPNFNKIKSTLKNLDMGNKYSLIELAGEPDKVEVSDDELWIQFSGCDIEEVKKFIDLTVSSASVPEPLRAAHIIGQGISMGESNGGA